MSGVQAELQFSLRTDFELDEVSCITRDSSCYGRLCDLVKLKFLSELEVMKILCL